MIYKKLLRIPFMAVASFPSIAFSGSWLLGFSPADTVAPGSYAVIAGTGGQWSSVGNPSSDSFTPFLAHAGIRTGLTDSWDIGYRLATVALPYSAVGASLGGEFDIKHRLTNPGSAWPVAILAGMGYAYLDIQGQSRNAWSPGFDMVISHKVAPDYTAFMDLRYVYTVIPSASGGSAANHFQATGPGVGVKIALQKNISLTPEIGVFRFKGAMAEQSANGSGIQYGAVLGFLF